MIEAIRKGQKLILLIDLGLTLLALGLAKWLRETIGVGVPLGSGEPLPFSNWLYVIVAFVWILVFSSYGVFNPTRPLQRRRDLTLVWGAVTGASFTFAGVSYLIFRDLSRLLFVYFYVLDVLFLCGWRWLLPYVPVMANQVYGPGPRRVLIIGATPPGQRLAEVITTNFSNELTLVGFASNSPPAQLQALPVLGRLDEVPALIQKYQLQEIIFSIPPAQQPELRALVMKLQELPVNLRVMPDAFDVAFLRTPLEEFDGIALTTLPKFPL